MIFILFFIHLFLYLRFLITWRIESTTSVHVQKNTVKAVLFALSYPNKIHNQKSYVWNFIEELSYVFILNFCESVTQINLLGPHSWMLQFEICYTMPSLLLGSFVTCLWRTCYLYVSLWYVYANIMVIHKCKFRPVEISCVWWCTNSI
jgi:hypothetical protein